MGNILRLSIEEYERIISSQSASKAKFNVETTIGAKNSKALGDYEQHLVLDAHTKLAEYTLSFGKGYPLVVNLRLGLRQLEKKISQLNTTPVRVPLESIEQALSLLWLKKNHPVEYSLTTAVPLGGHRSKGAGGQMKGEGSKPGYPDILMDFPAKKYHGLRIEMKARSPSKHPSDDQLFWLTNLSRLGYATFLCRGHRAAIAAFSSYLTNNQDSVACLEEWELTKY